MIETFGDRLKRLREENNVTQEEVATEIQKRYGYKIDKPTISKYENNIHTPKQFIIVEYMADFFGVHIDYMTGRSNDKYGEEIKYIQIPILGTIAAGVPIIAQEDILGHEYILPNENLDFCLKVKGDSMIGARIFDGDIVYIRKQEEVENGEIAAIQIDGEEATLKRFYRENGRVVLHAENPIIPDIIFSAKDKKLITILGKVIYVKFKVRWYRWRA